MGQKEKQDKLLNQRYYSERKNKKLFHLGIWRRKKKRDKPQASTGFLHIRRAGGERGREEGGDNGSQHTGNFKRHCLETRNEEKASMCHDYLRTGLARWASLLQTLPKALERLSNKTSLNCITWPYSLDVLGHNIYDRVTKSFHGTLARPGSSVSVCFFISTGIVQTTHY